MAHLKGTFLACLGAALIALAAVSLKAGEPRAGAAKEKDAAVSGHMVIF